MNSLTVCHSYNLELLRNVYVNVGSYKSVIFKTYSSNDVCTAF